MPTAIGDANVMIHMAWALDGVLLLRQSPLLVGVEAAIFLVGVGLHRWRHRR